ncbi:MAG TPA: hypothetical protein H9662_07495 [Firmicutes bacterium]|nr:hypothetical protein [Bacillota bacterium]
MKQLISFAAVLMVLFCCSSCTSKTVYTRGTWEGNLYTNETLCFTYTMPDGWTAKSDDALMDLISSGYAALTEEQKKDYDYSKNKTVYDFMVSEENGMSSLQLMVENLSMTAGASSMKEVEYAQSLREQLQKITSMTYTVGEPYTTELYDCAFLVLPVVVETPTVDGERPCQNYYIHKAGKLMAIFTGVFLESEQDDFEQMLSESLQPLQQETGGKL